MRNWQKITGVVALAFMFSLSLAHAAGQPGWIGTEQASRAAVEKIGGGKVLLVSTADNGKPVYHILAIDKGNRYDVDVNATNGQVVKFAKTEINRAKLSPRGMAVAQSRFAPEEVRPKALALSGGGDIVRTDRIAGKDGGSLYHFEIVNKDIVYSLEIDANTGAVVKQEEMLVNSAPTA